jgi:hypothetical protein
MNIISNLTLVCSGWTCTSFSVFPSERQCATHCIQGDYPRTRCKSFVHLDWRAMCYANQLGFCTFGMGNKPVIYVHCNFSSLSSSKVLHCFFEIAVCIMCWSVINTSSYCCIKHPVYHISLSAEITRAMRVSVQYLWENQLCRKCKKIPAYISGCYIEKVFIFL